MILFKEEGKKRVFGFYFFALDEIMSLANSDSIITESRSQILHGQRVFAILVGTGLGLRTMTGTRSVAGASFAVLKCVIGHV